MDAYVASQSDGALRQGELLSNVVELRVDLKSLKSGTGDLDIPEKVHPFALVLTQDCDLEWDYHFQTREDPNDRQKFAAKELPNILLCEVWPAKKLKGYLGFNSPLWKPVRQNRDERFHFLPRPTPAQDALGEGFEDDFAIDFKRVFTVGGGELYFRLTTEAQRRCCLKGPFMQHLSNRFGYYQLRVALPETGDEPDSRSDWKADLPQEPPGS